MPALPDSTSFNVSSSNMLLKASHWLSGLNSANQGYAADFTLDKVQLLDERLRPKAPMPYEDIDILTRMNLSNIGLRNSRRVTPESHPELYQVWTTLCQRAGYGDHVPQLIIAESPMINAIELSNNEMVITTGLMNILNMRELASVLGHELGHGRHDHTGVRVAAMGTFGAAGAIAGNYAAKNGAIGQVIHQTIGRLGSAGKKVANWMAGHHPHETAGRPASLLGYLGLIGLGSGIGYIAANQVAVKPTELQADLDGLAISGDPEAQISALAKLEAHDDRRGLKRTWSYIKSGYPTIQERIATIERAKGEMTPNPVPLAMEAAPAVKVHAIAHQDKLADAAQEISDNSAALG